METHSLNIRQIVRSQTLRQSKVASITATMAFEDELRMMLADQRGARPALFSAEDVKLFANSFLTFFICAAIFLS
jgi:hypothetical protein